MTLKGNKDLYERIEKEFPCVLKSAPPPFPLPPPRTLTSHAHLPPHSDGIREFKSAKGTFATLTFQYPDINLPDHEKAYHVTSKEAADVMTEMVGKEVYFDVIFSAKWAKYIATDVTLV